MGIAALIALGVALVCGYFTYSYNRKMHAMVTTETFTVRQLGELRDAASQAAGPGAFRHTCEVKGVARRGPEGLLTSDIGEKRCVWHRHVVTRKYWKTERDSEGRSRRVERTEKVAERVSEIPFAVEDQTGRILVHPKGTQVDELPKAVDRFEREKQQRTQLKMGKFSMSLPSGGRSGTIGYRYEEWILKPGTRLYVLGQASDGYGELVVEKPDSGPFVISTKDEMELVQQARKFQQIAIAVGAVALVAAAVLGVLWLLS